MADMYEHISPPKQHKTGSGKGKLLLLVAIAVVVLLACIVPAVRILAHQYGYKQFISALSSQTSRAYYKQDLRAEVDGVSLRITGDHAYTVYNAMAALGAGKFGDKKPQEEPDAVLYYGIRAVMKLWDVPLSGTGTYSRGVYVEFESLETSFSYIMVGKDMDFLMTALAPDKNPLWDDEPQKSSLGISRGNFFA